MPSLTRVTFKVKADLDIGQNIRITGDNRTLGSFSPNRGLDLVTTPKEYPIWRTNRPVNLPTGIPLSYKYVIFSGGQFHGWEPISAHARVIIPDGSEMEVNDEVGVYDEDMHFSQINEGRTQHQVGASLSRQPSGSCLQEPGQRRRNRDSNLHPHVRFQVDEKGDIATSLIDSADISAGEPAAHTSSTPARDHPDMQDKSMAAKPNSQVARDTPRPSSWEVNQTKNDTKLEEDKPKPNQERRTGIASIAEAAWHTRSSSDNQDILQQQRRQIMEMAESSWCEGSYDNSGSQYQRKLNRFSSAGVEKRTDATDTARIEAEFRSSPAARPQKLKKYRMLLVTYNLPLFLKRNQNAPVGQRWQAEWNPDSISGRSEDSVANDHSVTWVGAITPYVLIDPDVELCWQLTEEDKTEIKSKLHELDCVPIFLDKNVFVDHYVRSCLLRIRDIFHNVLSVSIPNEARRRLEVEKSAGLTDGPEATKPTRKRDRWEGFVKGSKIFADVIMDLVMQNLTDRDLVWVHNYPLMLVPSLLREKANALGLTLQLQPKIVFFLHTPFPTSEIFRTLSVRNELLEGVLGANIVGFHTFDHARHFITSCKRFLGLQFHSQEGGRLVVDHMDRAVLIAISHVGIEKTMLNNAVESEECTNLVQSIREKYRGRIIIVGMDELTRLNGVPLKLLAFEKLLNEIPKYRDKVVFIQHGLRVLAHQLIRLAEADVIESEEDRSGKLEEGVRAIVEVKELCDRINRVHGPVAVFKEYPVNAWPTVEQRAAIWSSADIMICTPVMEGLNLLPLEYAYCHRDPAGVVIMSEFSAASRVLNGAIRINCYDMEEIVSAFDQALCMSVEERNARRERDCGYISNRSSAAWTRNIIMDVEAGIHNQSHTITALDKDIIQGSEYHSVVSFENVVLEGFCQPLVTSDVARSFGQCSKRILFLDYAGTLAPRELGNLAVKRDFLGISKRKLAPKVSAILKLLCSDPKNIVFVISGNSTDVLMSAFAEILSDPRTPLGIVAHSGVMIRWGNVLKTTSDLPRISSPTHTPSYLPSQLSAEAAINNDGWEYILPGVADTFSGWIEAAEIPDILEDYTWRTGGSSWRQTDVTTSWQFRQADPEWGGMQAIKLQHELEEAIASVNVPIAVTRKKHTVELLPKGVDKGKAVNYILEEVKRRIDFQAEFCFCVGDDTSDEPMYTTVLDFMGMATQEDATERFGHAYTCTVGRKPTAAQYYLNDTEQVVDVLHELSKATAPSLKKSLSKET